MHAIRIHGHGAPDVLRYEEIPDPTPGPGQVAIAVAAIGVVFSETQVRAGLLARFGLAGPEFPYTFGRDVAGTIVATGTGVDPALVGRRVIASTDGTGGYAEIAVVDAADEPRATGASFSCLTEIPDGLDFPTAAALLGQGRTAAGLVRTTGIRPQDTVLITAAGGAIGSLLVQLCRLEGARVIAAAGGVEKVALATSLGADVAIDYTAEGWAGQVRDALGGEGVDVVFDATGGDIARAAFSTAADGRGRIVIYGLSSGELVDVGTAELLRRGLTVKGFSAATLTPAEVRGLQAYILDLAAGGLVAPVVGQTFPLADAAAAHAAVEARETIGKTLLAP
jgi:NADPH:quinone reductase